MDNVVLYGPGGASPVNIGSWLRADPGADYGSKGLLHAIESEAFQDGGQFVYDRAGIRRMQFPLLVGSGPAGLSLTQIESLLRQNSRPGGYIDVQPEGVASAEAVRFDIVHGRWEPDYALFLQRVSRRPGNLLLDTQPYGYWPTYILLASAAPGSAPVALSWNPANLIGDAPQMPALIQARMLLASIGPLASMTAGGANRFSADAIWWSLGRPSGATAFLSPSQFISASFYVNQGFTGLVGASVASDGAAPLGVTMQNIIGTAISTQWFPFAEMQTSATIYAGRYRVFAYMRSTPSVVFPIQIMSDETNGFYGDNLASANPVATLLPYAAGAPVPSFIDNISATSIYQILDLGEHTFPPAGSGMINSWRMRLWMSWGATAPPGPSAGVLFGGIHMQSVDQAGILARGLIYPTQNVRLLASNVAAQLLGRHLLLDTVANRTLIPDISVGSALDGFIGIIGDVRRNYRGPMPYIAASNANLDLGWMGRSVLGGATSGAFHAPSELIGGSISYRPQFQFLKGL